MALPLLSTKLYSPQISDRHIMRGQLIKKLSDGYNDKSQLSLICAPAGYGKTTIAVEFLKEINACSAWISLDEGDNDAGRFISYMSAALKKAGVVIGNDIDSLVTDLGFDTTETVMTMLINSIIESSGNRIVVFDDYHVITSQKINDIMKFLLDHQPVNLHIVLISREDPRIPLSRLRMKGNMTEVRMGDLLFSKEEAAELFFKADIRLNADAADKITSRTEGWIAGLQLAGLLLKNCGENQIEEQIRRFDGTSSYIIDYLVEEVLDRQSAEVRSFLCRTSVLDRMNGELCDVLMERADSREFLQRIEKANLFLIPLDDKREWYRYHHLFADSLKSCLLPDEERELYKKAAVWMKAKGFSSEAVGYAFKSGDMQIAIRMVEDSTEEAFRNAQLDTLNRWIDQLPGNMVRNSEVLSVRKAISYFITGRAREAVEYMATLNGEFEQNASPHNKGLLFCLRAMMAGPAGQDAEPYAHEALKLLEPWDPIARTSALNSLGRAQYRKGRTAEAMETFKSAYEAGLRLGYQFVTTLALMNYSSCLRVMGRPDEALALCDQYIEGMKKQFDRLPPHVGILYVTMADIFEETGRGEKAVWYGNEGNDLCRSISYDGTASIQIFSKRNSENSKDDARPMAGPNGLSDIPAKENDEIVLAYGEKLSAREVEILRLIIGGMTNQEIAGTLFISVNTTQWHISHIYSKLGVKNRTQAIIKARELGIV